MNNQVPTATRDRRLSTSDSPPPFIIRQTLRYTYSVSVMVRKLLSFVKEAAVDAFRLASNSKEGLKRLYGACPVLRHGVSLYRDAVYSHLASSVAP